MNKQLVNLFVALAFSVVVVSGVLVFFQPFSIVTTGLHALMGVWFSIVIILHVKNNFKGLKKSLKKKYLLISFFITLALTLLFIWQPAAIKSILALSSNEGVADDLFEMKNDGMVYNYAPAENYKLKLEVKAGPEYKNENPPQIAIWLENKSFYHIKTLYTSESAEGLPYWSWKVREYEKAKKESETKKEDVDAISSATPNSSFDPRDYILPERNKEEFYLLIEIDDKNDKNEFFEDQPSLIFKVEIDNKFPKHFQVLDIVGYSKYEEDDEVWSAYYPDETLTTALKLIDSALLTIERK